MTTIKAEDEDDLHFLTEILDEQSRFTEALRVAANEAVAYLSHIQQNYAKDIPDDLLRAMLHKKVMFDVISIQPAPVVRGLAH